MEACASTSRNETDPVLSLIETPLASRTQVEKESILKEGRPTPIINAIKNDNRRGKTFLRSFNHKWYSTSKWLAGSLVTNRLYCWPCLLLSSKKSVWISEGFFDLKNISRGIHHHSCTVEHVHCEVELKGLEKSLNPVAESLSDLARLCKAQYNENVRKNREILKRLIDLTVFLCKGEFAFCGHKESSHSQNSGYFQELFYCVIKHDSEMQKHCRLLGAAFTGLSRTVQNELMECLSEEVADFIQVELKQTPFFSVQVDTVEMTEKSQSSIITRFVDQNGDIQERFLGFHDVSSDATTNGLYEVLISVLEDLSFKQKLISQCYDGASVTAGDLRDFQAKIRSEAPEALFVHSAAHQLNLVLQHGASCIQETLVFFSHVRNFPTFFHTTAKRSEVLSRIIGKRIPSHTDVRWSSNLELLTFLSTHRDSLILVFRDVIEASAREISAATREQADTLLNTLNDFHFVFLLLVYRDIFKITDVLCDILQKNIFNANFCFTQMQSTTKHIGGLTNDTRANKYIKNATNLTGPPTASYDSQQPYCDKYKNLYFEIMDNISTQLGTRFCDIQNLEFLALVDSTRFETYNDYWFPESALNSLKKFYGKRFDYNRLRSELRVIYADSRFSSLSVSAAIKLLHSSELNDVLEQVHTLFCLVASIPMTSSSEERSFSCLNRIKTCLGGIVTQERLTALSTLYIENKLLSELQARESWYDDVIGRFARKKERRIDLIYEK